MTQNIYDDEKFFRGYSRLPRSVEGLDAAPEWPTLSGLVPDMRGQRVLDLGCGFGWFCRWARQEGAAQVLGVDVSKKMLSRAVAATSDTAIAYTRPIRSDSSCRRTHSAWSTARWRFTMLKIWIG